MSPREKEPGQPSTPQRVAEGSPSPYPSGDYSYVLEIVMRMQDTMGQLKEAVSSLKDQSRSHGEKLDAIAKDVHAAKVTMGVLSAVILGAAALIGWIVNTYISTHAGQ